MLFSRFNARDGHTSIQQDDSEMLSIESLTWYGSAGIRLLGTVMQLSRLCRMESKVETPNNLRRGMGAPASRVEMTHQWPIYAG